jgi:hypothetical protein
VRVELKDYYADVFLNGSRTPLVHEVDRNAGTDTLEEAALHRVVLRARATPGTISVFQDTAAGSRLTAEATDLADRGIESGLEPALEFGVNGIGSPPEIPHEDEIASHARAGQMDEQVEPANKNAILINLGGELIGAVEQGVNASGEDFSALFNQVRLELTDDYSFLDPMTNELTYAGGVASVSGYVTETAFVTGLSEALRRVVDKVAVGDRTRRVRERIALELLGVARKRKEALEYSSFRARLDQIAGTKVI